MDVDARAAVLLSNDQQRENSWWIEWAFLGNINPVRPAVFIIGLHEGLEYAEARMPSYFPGVPYGDVLKGVDRFYEEPENLTFPVLYALEVFALKVNGATQSEIEKNLAERRQRIKEMELAIKKKGEGK